MSVFKSKIVATTDGFMDNAAHMRNTIDDLNEKIENISHGGPERARDKHLSRGKLLPRDRVQRLLDPGSPFLEFSQLAAYDMYGGDIAAAGIITGIGRVGGTECVSGVIMGLPTRFYDGAMTEWHSMANVVASDGNAILAWDSPWRTDKSSISMFLTHTTAASVSPRNINDAYASDAQAIINEDLTYKGYTVNNTITTTSSSGSSGGGVLPPNPCGG